MATHLSQLWRRRQEAAGRRMLFLLARIVHHLPLPAALRLGRALGWLAPRISPRHYRRIFRDIERSLGAEMAPAEIAATAYRAYRHLGESLMEFLRLPAMSAEEVRRMARLEGTEHLDAALAQGNGVVLVTAHLGNWEVCGTVMGVSRYPTTAIARPQRDTALTALFTRLREAHGLKVVPMSDVRGCIRVLKRNECLGILGDVNARVPGAFVQFLGHPAATYTGAAYLAMTTGAAVIPLFDQRLPDNTHRIRISPPIPMVDTGDRQRDLLVNTIRIQYVIQQEIRRRPHEWYWLIQRWKTRPEDVPNPDRIPMEHRDLSPQESAEAIACFDGQGAVSYK